MKILNLIVRSLLLILFLSINSLNTTVQDDETTAIITINLLESKLEVYHNDLEQNNTKNIKLLIRKSLLKTS